MKAAVIGAPVSHSLSPAIFDFLAHRTGYSLDYTAQPITQEELPIFLEKIRHNFEYIGLNITIPLKESVLNELDECSPEAQAIGAVNVIHCTAAGLKGFNTDVIGIQKTLEAQSFTVKGSCCLLIGAGGAAKAVAWVLGSLRAAQVWVYNPRSNRGHELAETFQRLFPHTKFHPIADLSEIPALPLSLVVNATPIGMQATHTPELFTPLKTLTFAKPALAFDLIYTPAHTVFLQTAQALALQTIGGLSMLIDQALATWAIWGYPLTNAPKLHQSLQWYLKGILTLRENPNALFLTGFMGIGKSTVAQELARLTQRRWLDTDQLIETQSGLSVTALFQQRGETEFRQLEKHMVEQVAASQQTVVSLGGGSLMAKDNLNQVLDAGPLVHLSGTLDTLGQRLATAPPRPLFAGLDTEGVRMALETLLAQRAPAYSQAPFSVATDGQSPLEVAQAVLIEIGAHTDSQQ